MTLATFLRQAGKEVIILHMFEYRYRVITLPSAESLDKLRDFAPDLIGIGFMSTDHKPAKIIIERLRADFPSSVIVAGGRHPSNFAEDVLNWGTDFVVVGEGETGLMELIRALEDSIYQLEKIPGVAFQNDKGQFSFCYREEEDADLDVIPSYDLVSYQNYVNARMALVGRYLKAGWLATSRGCFSRCIYCRDTKFGRRLRLRSMDAVMEDIRTQLINYDIDCFYLLDDMFAIKENRVIEFCNRFCQIQQEFGKKLSFAATARSDTLTQNMVDALKRANCTQLSIGLESGSQKIHEFLNTGKHVDTVVQTFEILRSTGIDTFVNLIIGIPGETEEDIEKTVDIIKKIKPTTVGVSFLTAYPGTPLFSMAIENEWIKKENLSSLTYLFSLDRSELNSGISQEILNNRKTRIYKLTFTRTLCALVFRNEFVAFCGNIFLIILKRPRNFWKIIKNLLLRRVDDLKELYRWILFEKFILENRVKQRK